MYVVLDGHIQIHSQKAETLAVASKETGIEVNVEKKLITW
jgi:hypothetical protein